MKTPCRKIAALLAVVLIVHGGLIGAAHHHHAPAHAQHAQHVHAGDCGHHHAHGEMPHGPQPAGNQDHDRHDHDSDCLVCRYLAQTLAPSQAVEVAATHQIVRPALSAAIESPTLPLLSRQTARAPPAAG